MWMDFEDIREGGTDEELMSLVVGLKGKKVLIKGNHDKISSARYIEGWKMLIFKFERICDRKKRQEDGENF